MPTNIDARSARIVSTDIARTSDAKASLLARHRIKEGDLIFPRRGDLNKVAVATKENEGGSRHRVSEGTSEPRLGGL